MSDRDAVLFANEAFYMAFAERNMEAMEKSWAESETVTCIHPGWGVLQGHEKVMQSWLSILANPDSPEISCRNATAHVHGAMAVVTCFEEIDGNFLIASNIFVKDGSTWRLVHHQAGPTNDTPSAEEPSGPSATIN